MAVAWSPALAAFVADFNAGRFFEAHEDLEPLWRQRGRSPLLQGLILFAAAWVKVQRGNRRGARRHLEATLRYLEPLGPAAEGIDIAGVLAHARRCLELLGPDDASEAGSLPAGELARTLPPFTFRPVPSPAAAAAPPRGPTA
jgi:predicted metal-dependent hydrolase